MNINVKIKRPRMHKGVGYIHSAMQRERCQKKEEPVLPEALVGV